MNAALIAIGTEITRGIIQDKHGRLISKELTSIGIDVKEIILLPDDGSIEIVLSDAEKKFDLIIVTGGLGPTSDDMTRNIIAKASNKELVLNDEAWSALINRVGKERAEGANKKQAMIPQGFSLMPNPNGTAPGFYGSVFDSTLLFALPGPPREMEPMFYNYVLPLLKERMKVKEGERDEYSTFLIPEAKLEELCLEADRDLVWATRFQEYKISLYVSGKTRAERNKAIEKIRAMVGPYRIIEGDVTALSLISDSLKKKGASISVAESLTGGLASALLTSLPGSSSYTLGSVTSYAVSVKEKLLGVKKETVKNFGVVSPECASEMAEGVRGLIESTYALSFTGVAGPEKLEAKDVGTVCMGFSSSEKTESVEVHFSSYGRDSVRRKSVTAGFLLLYAFLDGKNTGEVASLWAYI